MSEILRIALAALLAGAALSKLASGRAGEEALATFGFGEGPVRVFAWGSLIAVELGLAAGVAAGSEEAAYAAAALMAMLATVTVSALIRGRAGAPCPCFGSRSRVSAFSVARSLLLAAAFAAVA